jgi:hypothetical protein
VAITKVIKLELANANPGAGRVNRSRAQVHTGHFGEHHTDIFLLVSELPHRGGDLGWCKNRGRHLIEQRLEDVVIALVDQNDFRIASFQSASRGDSSKSAADDHDTLSPHLSRSSRQSFARPRRDTFLGWPPNFLQWLGHSLASLRLRGGAAH